MMRSSDDRLFLSSNHQSELGVGLHGRLNRPVSKTIGSIAHV